MPRRHPRGRTAYDAYAEAQVPADEAPSFDSDDYASESDSYYSESESEYSSREVRRGRPRKSQADIYRERVDLIKAIEDYRTNDDLAAHIPDIGYTTSMDELRSIRDTCVTILETRQQGTAEAGFLNMCDHFPLWTASAIQWVNIHALSPKRQLAFDDLNKQVRIAIRNGDFKACHREFYRRYIRHWFGGLATNPIVSWMQIMVGLCIKTHVVSNESYKQGATDPRKVRAQEAAKAAEEESESYTDATSEAEETPLPPPTVIREPWAPVPEFTVPPKPEPTPQGPAQVEEAPDEGFVLDIPGTDARTVVYSQVDFDREVTEEEESSE